MKVGTISVSDYFPPPPSSALNHPRGTMKTFLIICMQTIAAKEYNIEILQNIMITNWNWICFFLLLN